MKFNGFLGLVICAGLVSSASAQQARPLAYVRSLVVTPVRAEVADVAGAYSAAKGLLAGRLSPTARIELLLQRVAVRASAPRLVQAEVRDVLGKVAAVKDVRMSAGHPNGSLTDVARDAGADAALAVTVDRCGLQVGLERSVWLRVAGQIATTAGDVRGPFYGVGVARATRKFIGKGYTRTDEELTGAAARQAITQMAHAMRTGEIAPFAEGCRVLVVRATVPDQLQEAVSQPGPGPATVIVPLPSLSRESDVLFQPDLPPTAEIIDPGEGDAIMAVLSMDGGELWSADNTLDRERLRGLTRFVGADFIFISRMAAMAMEEDPVEVPDGALKRPGVEKKVDVTVAGALYSAAVDKVLWQDTVEGGTIARTEYVRHKPRIRTDQQAVMDAVHTAYAYLRYSFDEFHRRFSR